MQHQALAAAAHGALQQGFQFLVRGGALLRHGDQPGRAGQRQQLAQRLQALGEGAGLRRQVEHHEADLAPGSVVGRLAAHGGDRLLELAAAGPEFAVHGQAGPVRGEPGRRLHRLAAAQAQLLAVPVAAHAVELLADPVVGERHARPIDLGQHQRRWRPGAPACAGASAASAAARRKERRFRRTWKELGNRAGIFGWAGPARRIDARRGRQRSATNCSNCGAPPAPRPISLPKCRRRPG